MDRLPAYMKLCFFALFNTINKIAYDILRDQGVDNLPLFEKAVFVFFILILVIISKYFVSILASLFFF
jgi:hypothetical protein